MKKAFLFLLAPSFAAAAPILLGPLSASGGGFTYTGLNNSGWEISFSATDGVNNAYILGSCSFSGAGPPSVPGSMSLVGFSTFGLGCNGTPLRINSEAYMTIDLQVGNGGGYIRAYSGGELAVEVSLIGYVSHDPQVCVPSGQSVECSHQFYITDFIPPGVSDVPETSSLSLGALGLLLVAGRSAWTRFRRAREPESDCRAG